MPKDDKRRLLAIYHMEEIQVLALALVNTSDFNYVGLRWRFYHVKSKGLLELFLLELEPEEGVLSQIFPKRSLQRLYQLTNIFTTLAQVSRFRRVL